MPLQWTVDHQQQLVTAVVGVGTTIDDLYAFLGALIDKRAMGYAKIFDATRAIQWIDGPQVEAFAATARLYTTMRLGPVGPLAIVVVDAATGRHATDYVEKAGTKRPVRICSSSQEARDWIAALRLEDEGKSDGTNRDR